MRPLSERTEWLESELFRITKRRKRYLTAETSEIEGFIYFLSQGDLSRRNSILDTPYKVCLEYFYIRKVEEINQAIANLPTEE
jgi:hypothetical protein